MKLSLLQFVYEGALLSFRGPLRADQWDVIPDFSVAKNRAWAQTDAFPIWSDVRSRAAVSSGANKKKGDALLTAVYELVYAYAPFPFGDLEDDIAGDLIDCVSYQRQGVGEERLYPMLLDAYALGGWPCGWSGEYPSGKLCVFWPTEPVPIPDPTSIHVRRVTLQKRRLRERIASAAEPSATSEHRAS